MNALMKMSYVVVYELFLTRDMIIYPDGTECEF
jgi:hypothetical protein